MTKLEQVSALCNLVLMLYTFKHVQNYKLGKMVSMKSRMVFFSKLVKKKKKMQKRWFNAFKSCLESHKAGHTVFLIVQQVMYPEFDQCQ